MTAGSAVTWRGGPAALLAAAALAGVLSRGGGALAEVRSGAAVIACVDPRATAVLTDPDLVARHTERWRSGVARRGRCFSVPPGERWEPLLSSGGLVLMRKVPPQAGLPPLYFRPGLPPDPQAGAPVAVPPPAGSGGPLPASGILTETLPPLPAAPVPGAALPDAPLPPQDVPAPAAPAIQQSKLSTASARGYAIGFAMAIILIVLLLTALTLLLRLLLRRSPEQAGSRADPHGGEPMRLAFPGLAAASMQAAAPLGSPPARPPAAFPAASALFDAGRRAAPAARPGIRTPPLANASVQERCAALLREAGWEARILPGSDRRRADVLARRRGRVVALRCLPAASPVDEQEVEEACLAREREQADLGVIVSEAAMTEPARRLAARIGIELLHDHQLRAFFA